MIGTYKSLIQKVRETLLVALTFVAISCQAQHSEENVHNIPQKSNIVVGAERMDQYLELAKSKHTAIVANQTSRVGNSHLVDTLLSLGADIRLIFCPEHGFRGDAAAGATVGNSIDPKTKLPIVSLYGSNKKPTQETLDKYDIELIIFDLQDVGCRFYTYISTMHYVMESVAERTGCSMIVLDRPNPNGHYVDGPVLEPSLKSFVGMHPGVPVVYGMTIGEYALMVNGEGWLKNNERCQLQIVQLDNYTHDSIYHLPVNPSPNLRTPQAIALYPSLCLFEGTHISVGRGTPYPFEIIGNDYKMDLRKVEVANKFDLKYLLEMYQHTPKGKFFLNNNFFDKLAGNTVLRQQIIQGIPEKKIRDSWEPKLSQFKEIRKKYLLYR